MLALVVLDEEPDPRVPENVRSTIQRFGNNTNFRFASGSLTTCRPIPWERAASAASSQVQPCFIMRKIQEVQPQ
jgi:hypothetical protein